MQLREKILLGSFVSAMAVWQGGSVVSSLVFGPLNDRQAQLTNLDQDLTRKKRDEAKIRTATRNLKKWGASSLPPDPLLASTLYQHWLIDLASKSKLASATVSPGQGLPKEGVYTLLPFTVKAQGKLSELCDFLYEFQRADLLHRIARMGLSATQTTPDPVLDITLNVEGLALVNAPKRTTLFAAGGETAVASQMQAKPRSTYEPLAKRNLFARGYNGPPEVKKESPPPPATPATDSAKFIFLVGVIEEEGSDQRTVWLFDRSSNQRSILTKGGPLDHGGFKGTVDVIGANYVLFQVAGETWRLELGQNLREMEKQPKVDAAASTTTSSAPPAAPAAATVPASQ